MWDSHAYCDSDSYAYTDSDANGHSNSYAHADSYGNGHSNSYAYADSYAYVDAYGPAETKPDASPVQFGRSTICSFSPVGSGTPGTVYLVDGGGQLWAARCTGAGGRVRVLRYDAASRKWETR